MKELIARPTGFRNIVSFNAVCHAFTDMFLWRCIHESVIDSNQMPVGIGRHFGPVFLLPNLVSCHIVELDEEGASKLKITYENNELNQHSGACLNVIRQRSKIFTKQLKTTHI